MNIDKHVEAIRQYRVLADDVDNSTAEERAAASAHRAEYGDEYMPRRTHGPENAALLLRFMHEVHGIPLSDASRSVIGLIKDLDALSLNGHDPVAVATGLLRSTGNVLIAAATASLYAEAAKGSEFDQSWQDVVDAVSRQALMHGIGWPISPASRRPWETSTTTWGLSPPCLSNATWSSDLVLWTLSGSS